ncbi:MAG: hypothetical protein HGA80_03965 [Candidatus Omnitrophica bacterium]|nr:hypothetical protein [Candidatus Omnitrophota bacterium]
MGKQSDKHCLRLITKLVFDGENQHHGRGKGQAEVFLWMVVFNVKRLVRLEAPAGA